MRMPTRLKTRLDSLIKTRLSSVVGRHFRRNEGTTDYATIPAVTLAGDFVIEFEFTVSITTGFAVLLGNSANTDTVIFVNGVSGKIHVRVRGGPGGIEKDIASSSSVNDGLIHKVNFSRVNTESRIIIDGTVEQVVNFEILIGILDLLYKNVNGNNLNGILANLKIWDNGPLIRDYPLDEPKGTSTIYDLVGGNNGTIINGNDEDKGLFTQQADGDWKGNSLTVPLWDSVDQILVKA